ncbi:hypothetical protein MKW94_021554 [Papaver nudicaule]|uniref:CBF1-interacting co-repressor CIR N-terminal domain-containing protein n=1 Tax=Papaver nudicaule TaxID=74823 RepID=A0AA41VQV9_PAPNU|nr:hypothetical protein [Papaver nudicaule]
MGMKFLNKKGWHTGSIRNIETVWKAEQKRDAEELKIEELRKQIKEEREKAEFRQLQVEAGLVPRQERLDFLYDSGLSVGKPSSADGFKELEALPTAVPAATAAAQPQTLNPGALFEEKPQSANDAWRKLNSDPLLQIRKREQEAMARIKNNPIQMAMIKESVSGKKKHDDKERKKKKKKSRHSSSKGGSKDDATTSKGDERREKRHRDNRSSDSEADVYERRERNKKSNHKSRNRSDSEPDSTERGERKKRTHHGSTNSELEWSRKRSSHDHSSSKYDEKKSSMETVRATKDRPPVDEDWRSKSRPKRRQTAVTLTEEERAARLKEMQMDAEVHEEQRWTRLKKASEADALEEKRSAIRKQNTFLDDAQRSVYGTGKGGSSTIEESVRRRKFFMQGQAGAGETNAFRR